MSIEIRKASSKKEMRAFIDFPTDLYRKHPCYVPNLRSDDAMTFDREANAAFDFCEAEFFLAYKDGKLVGRVAAIINSKANERWNTKYVRFGWIDFIEDREVLEALLDAVTEWGRERGMTAIAGPLGFTDFDPEGMLVEGFDQLSTMVTIYNYPYYPQHMEKFGFEKKADWVEFKLGIPDSVPEKHARISEIVKQKYGLKVVKYTNRKKAVREIGRPLFDLVNEAYAELFEFSQLTDRQIDYYIKMYIGMLNLDLLTIIKDSDDNLVGIGVAIPSLSRALQKANGHLFPFGWYHILRALYFNKTDYVDLLLVAIKPEYQSKGVNALLFTDLIPYFQRYKYKHAESNPELELNTKVQSQWQYFDATQHKRRRAYGKKI